MIAASALGIFLIPVLHVVVQRAREKITGEQTARTARPICKAAFPFSPIVAGRRKGAELTGKAASPNERRHSSGRIDPC